MAGRLKIYNNATSTWEYIGGYGKGMPAGDVVGTSDTQTLTNKTATSPIIDGAGGTTAGQLGFSDTDHELYVGGASAKNSIYVAHWKAWTPAWANLTEGSATNTGAYCQIGKLVSFWAKITFAADTSISGSVSLTLPVSPNAAYNDDIPIGNCLFHDEGSTRTEGRIYGNGFIAVMNCAGTYMVRGVLSSTVPHTWANTDKIYVTGTYEAA